MDKVVYGVKDIEISSKVKDHLEFTYADYKSFLDF